MRRWLPFLIALITGLSISLYYGWMINPVEYVDTAPGSLKSDFRTDYVLMAAETYQAKQDPALAARQLALLGSRPPAEISAEALAYAQSVGYDQGDLQLLQNLVLAMQTWQVSSGGISPMKGGIFVQILGGLAIGLAIGLLIAWVIAPVQYKDTSPASLRSEFKDQYREAIASAFNATRNLERAKARLSLLADPNSEQALISQAERMIAEGNSPDSAFEIAVLVNALKAEPQVSANPTGNAPPLTETSDTRINPHRNADSPRTCLIYSPIHFKPGTVPHSAGDRNFQTDIDSHSDRRRAFYSVDERRGV